MIIASMLKLPELRKTLKQMERKLESMDDAGEQQRKAG
jgi:hypothetical protein